MDKTVIEVSNLSKKYRLGMVGSNTIVDDAKRYWARLRGKEDPTLKIGQTNILADPNKRQTSNVKQQTPDYIWALKDVNFEVKLGEVLGIIGKNGAGKSTLLKILSKVTSPTKGNVKIKGRIASLLEVGTGFHSELTGRENIFLNGAILGMTKAEIKNKFDEIVDFSGVERYIDTPVKRYSSGMYVRLAFAVAAHLEPEILIIDEVLAVGDAEFQKKAIGKMQQVSHSQGRTVIFVSHNMGAISQLCEKTILLSQGTIMQNGNTNYIIEYYLKSFYKNEFSIFNPKKRTGSKDVYITEISILNEMMIKKDSFISGENMVIDVAFNSMPEINISNIVFGIGIDNPLGSRIFSGSSSWLGKVFSKLKKVEKFNVKFFINNLPFVRGTYLISIIVSNGIDTLDYVEHCASFSIMDSDISYALGRSTEHGEVKLKYEIKLYDNDSKKI